MNEEQTAKLEKELHDLTLEHKDLDKMIDILIHSRACDQIELQRMKKRKLWVKDRIAQINEILYPDIIA